MNKRNLEEFMGSLYADEDAQIRFRANPAGEARLFGLSSQDCDALTKMDWTDFELACQSFRRKRKVKAGIKKQTAVRRIVGRLRAVISQMQNSRQKT